MARWGRRWGSVAGWGVAAAAGLGTGAAVLVLLEPGRRARAHQALDRVGGATRELGDRVGAAARQAGERVSAFRSALPAAESVERRPGLLGSVLLARAVLGGGLLRIPFGLLGLSTLATSERGRAATAALTRALRGAAAALRSYSKAAAERSTRGGPAILGPDAAR
jgi:hypothetical protein